MLRLVLVRHGETFWNQARRIQGSGSDTDLSEMGREQAERLASLLSEEKVCAIYSSPLRRAIDTARAIARFHELTVEIVPDLKEIDAGELEGFFLEKLEGGFAQFLTQCEEGEGLIKMPGGESLTELGQRSWAAIQQIKEKHPEGIVVVVNHYFTILTIICQVLALPLAHIRRMRLTVGSISILDFGELSPHLVLFNDTCHLT